jgi:hypothetical protein
MEAPASPSCRCRRATLCVCFFALALSGQSRLLAGAKAESFQATSSRIVSELEHENLASFDNDVSSEGLLIVRREPDWGESNVTLKDEPIKFLPHGSASYLSFNGMKTVAWEEHEIFFNKPDLRNPHYVSLLNQFCGLVLLSQDNYHDFISSNQSEDGYWFRERELGPNIFGKIGSDECLYIYLQHESGKWRVWRLELWQRGAFQRTDR